MTWTEDVSRARADLETALALVMGIRARPENDQATIDQKQALLDARRLTSKAEAALDRALNVVR